MSVCVCVFASLAARILSRWSCAFPNVWLVSIYVLWMKIFASHVCPVKWNIFVESASEYTTYQFSGLIWRNNFFSAILGSTTMQHIWREKESKLLFELIFLPHSIGKRSLTWVQYLNVPTRFISALVLVSETVINNSTNLLSFFHCSCSIHSEWCNESILVRLKTFKVLFKCA